MNEKYYVVRGAELKCAFGDQNSKLQMPLDHGVFIDRDAQANLMDNKPMVNILPFGQCNAPLNPTLIAAKAASSGAVQKVPCIPVTVAPWIGTKMDAMVGKLPAVTNASCLLCAWMGRITVTNAGQKLESDKSPMTMEATRATLQEQKEAEQAAQKYQELYKQDPAAAKAMVKAERGKKMAALTGEGQPIKTGVGKTGEGIPLDEVDPKVLEQIYPDNSGAYGYLPKAGTAYAKYDFTDVEKQRENQAIRKEYLEQSKAIEREISSMKSRGASKEEIATRVVDMRNQDKVAARAKMSPEAVAPLEERNVKEYGNPVGPDAQWLFNKRKAKLVDQGKYQSDEQVWDEVIEGSMRKDEVINTLLGIRH